MINSRQGYFRCVPIYIGKDISLSYVRFFAEFLEDLSLVHLGLLAPPTCVGFRYGCVLIFLDAFLGNLLH